MLTYPTKRSIRTTICIAAALAGGMASPAAAQQQDVLYELVSYDGRPPTLEGTRVQLGDGLLLLRPNGRFLWRTTYTGARGLTVMVDSGTYRVVRGRLRILPDSGGEIDPFEVPAPGPDGLLRIPDGEAGGSVYQRVASTPWQDGTYRAVRLDGIPLPAMSRGTEWVCRTVTYSGGRYRLANLYGGTRPSTFTGTGGYRIRGRELDLQPDDARLAAREFYIHWSRKADGTLLVFSSDGMSWEYRPDPGASCPTPATAP